MNKSIWITWENHRRSRELAKAFNSKLYVLTYKQGAILRYPVLIIRTLALVLRVRPDYVFVQNPSIVLASVTCFFKRFLRYKLIVDRHSNFKVDSLNSRRFKWKLFHLLSRYTNRVSDYTIVTNEPLKALVDDWGGKGFVLEDKIPLIESGKKKLACRDVINIMCVTTFSTDEPILEIIEAAKVVRKDVNFHLTGNYKKYPRIKDIIREKPDNVTLTGFISDSEYNSLINFVDIVMVLTTEENLLTCGAYEAVGVDKPMILSNTKVIKEYFYLGAVYTTPDAESICDSVYKAIDNIEELKEGVCLLKKQLDEKWLKKFKLINDVIY